MKTQKIIIGLLIAGAILYFLKKKGYINNLPSISPEPVIPINVEAEKVLSDPMEQDLSDAEQIWDNNVSASGSTPQPQNSPSGRCYCKDGTWMGDGMTSNQCDRACKRRKKKGNPTNL